MGWKNRPLGRSGMPPPCVVRGKDKAAARPGTKIMRRSRRLVFRWRWSRPVRGVRRAAAAFGRTPPSNARRAARKTCAARLFRDRDVAASVAGESRAFGPANLWPTRPRPACARWSPSRERKPGSESVPAPRPAPHGFAVSAVRAGGPCLVPSRGGARKPKKSKWCRPTGTAIGAGAENRPGRGLKICAPRGQFFAVVNAVYLGTSVSLPGRASAADPLTATPAASCERLPSLRSELFGVGLNVPPPPGLVALICRR